MHHMIIEYATQDIDQTLQYIEYKSQCYRINITNLDHTSKLLTNVLLINYYK